MVLHFCLLIDFKSVCDVNSINVKLSEYDFQKLIDHCNKAIFIRLLKTLHLNQAIPKYDYVER